MVESSTISRIDAHIITVCIPSLRKGNVFSHYSLCLLTEVGEGSSPGVTTTHKPGQTCSLGPIPQTLPSESYGPVQTCLLAPLPLQYYMDNWELQTFFKLFHFATPASPYPLESGHLSFNWMTLLEKEDMLSFDFLAHLCVCRNYPI